MLTNLDPGPSKKPRFCPPSRLRGFAATCWSAVELEVASTGFICRLQRVRVCPGLLRADFHPHRGCHQPRSLSLRCLSSQGLSVPEMSPSKRTPTLQKRMWFRSNCDRLKVILATYVYCAFATVPPLFGWSRFGQRSNPEEYRDRPILIQIHGGWLWNQLLL